ncbi:MAG: molybdenum cofactor biosynthesis protein MoeB, partial [Chloroflexi bacterium]|nr:molybdenum cofactor biosynthesis protein MoeB [Chloroflexota bacterium]
ASKGACYRCIFPEPPPTESVPPCSVAGVVGVIPGLIGLIQATEVIKLILQIGTPLISKLLLIDALDWRVNVIEIPKQDGCKLCGPKPEINHLIDYEEFCKMPVQYQSLFEENAFSINPPDLKNLISNNGKIRLIDLREPVEVQISSIPNSENIPFHQLLDKMTHWDKSQPLVLICHIGFLSIIARRMLMEAGFKDVKHLNGGIRAWAQEVDRSLFIY